MPQADSAIDTSIVVCTCSRAHLLRGALTSLLQQDWAPEHAVELLVVDDGSADDTAALLAQFAVESRIPIRVFSGPQEGVAAARNLGFSQACGRWIASFDDDQIASPHWLRALRERADREDTACVGGALTLAFPAGEPDPPLGPRVRSVLGEHVPYAAAQQYASGCQPATNNALLRRDVFLALGGFDPRFTEGGEDKDLFQRVRAAGDTLWFEPAASASHITPPARLATVNLRWTSVRLGASDARSALLGGPRSTLQLVLTRLLSTALRDGPKLMVANQTERLNTRCSLWYTMGLLRGVRALLLKHPAESAFLKSLNFRTRNGERPGSPQASVSAQPLGS